MVRHLRRWYWRYIRRHDGETCDRCGRAYWFALGETYWLADDDLWAAVTGKAALMGAGCAQVVCPPCFTEEARTRGISIHWEAKEGV